MSDEDKKNEQEIFRVTDRRGQPKETDHTPSISGNPIQQPKIPAAGKEAKQPPKGQPRSIDFQTFVLSMSTSALMHMGLIEDQQTGKVAKNLTIAKQEVDIVEMLAEKTKGNLSPQEADMMEQVLYELRVRFVEASKSSPH